MSAIIPKLASFRTARFVETTPRNKMIAFVLPNDGSTQPLSSFVTTVDEVERLTGLDFFAGLEDEDALESVSDYPW